MAIETQSGAAMYRIHPKANYVIQVQPGPRLRWRVYARYRTADEARAALRHARGGRGSGADLRPDQLHPHPTTCRYTRQKGAKMTTQEDIKAFEGWCIVELFGHNVIAGYCSERVIAGAAMLQVDVPAVADRPAFTKLFTSGAIYGLTPTTEAHARVAAERIQARPVTLYILPETVRPRLAQVADPDGEDYDYGDEDDEDEPPL